MKAFTLIELIFIILIASILSFVGVYYIPDNTLISDAQMLKEKIYDKKSQALGYETVTENNTTCIKFNKNFLNEEENLSRVKYKFKSEIKAFYETNGSQVDTVCFDKLGRPYEKNVNDDLTNLIHTNIIINIQNRSKNAEINLTLYSITGFVR